MFIKRLLFTFKSLFSAIIGADDRPSSQLPREKPPLVPVSSELPASLPWIWPYPPSVLLHICRSLSFLDFYVLLSTPVKYDPLSHNYNTKLMVGKYHYEGFPRVSCGGFSSSILQLPAVSFLMTSFLAEITCISSLQCIYTTLSIQIFGIRHVLHQPWRGVNVHGHPSRLQHLVVLAPLTLIITISTM